MGLQGKVAIVTGAGGGIGRKFAEALGKAGASVILADINGDAAEEAAAELAKRGLDTLGIAADVTSESSVANMASAAVTRFGGIDILVNNAALMAALTCPPKNGPVAMLDLDEALGTDVARMKSLWSAPFPSHSSISALPSPFRSGSFVG